MTTFNVVFTRGTAARLLPFALSLRKSPGVWVRLVANGCRPEEVELMRAVAGRDERLSHHVLAFARTVEHGLALNELFERFPEPRFAFADSDVIASGDFMASLGPLEPGQAGVFSAPPVWVAEDDMAVPPPLTALTARWCFLPDGTYVGNSYCAIYDRGALEPAWRAAPLGFQGHHRHQVPRGLRRSLRARGWDFRWMDTGRLINLQLLLAGHQLEERRVPELHHVGGVSRTEFRGSVGGMRRALAMVRDNPGGRRLRRLADGVETRILLRFMRHPGVSQGGRRSLVLGYGDRVIDAIRAGERPPPAPTTHSPAVDRRVAELVAALETEYRRGLRDLDEAAATMPTRAGPR